MYVYGSDDLYFRAWQSTMPLKYHWQLSNYGCNSTVVPLLIQRLSKLSYASSFSFGALAIPRWAWFDHSAGDYEHTHFFVAAKVVTLDSIESIDLGCPLELGNSFCIFASKSTWLWIYTSLILQRWQKLFNIGWAMHFCLYLGQF